MIGDILQPTHLIFILVVALLVLGPKRLPEVGRSLGRGIRDFRGALSGIDEAVNQPSTPQQAPSQSEVVSAPSPEVIDIHAAPQSEPAPLPADPGDLAVESAPAVHATGVSAVAATPPAASGAIEFDMKSAFPSAVAASPPASAARTGHGPTGAVGPDPDDYAD